MEDKNQKLPSTRIQWYPGHMAKTQKQIEEDLKLIDVVIELLDARIPVSSQNPIIENLLKNKKRIIVLNKSDLANEVETKKWIDYYKNKNIKAISVDSNQGKGINQVENIILELMKNDLEVQKEKGRINKTIRVMIVGIPNVGKSSFINRLSKKTTMAVGNKPGVTKQKQWIRIGKQIKLLDTPGVLWPKFENQQVALNLAFTGSIKDEVVDRVEIAYYLIEYLQNNNQKELFEKYKIQPEEVNQDTKTLELMNLIGRKRGALISGGEIDENKVANIVLDDFKNGKIGRITLEKIK